MSVVVRGEHPLLSNRERDVLTATLLALATALVFLLVGLDSTRIWVQRQDDRFLREMVATRTKPLTDAAKVLDVIGGFTLMLIARLLVAAYLVFRRRWWHLSAFVLAVVCSEAFIGTLKGVYDRPRPLLSLSLVHTTGSSFPSGHAVAASATVVAIVLALFPAGRHRWGWGLAAALFAFVMGLSRAYLAAHWLSDAVAGTLLGVTLALGSALLVQWIWDERKKHRETPAEPALRPSGLH